MPGRSEHRNGFYSHGFFLHIEAFFVKESKKSTLAYRFYDDWMIRIVAQLTGPGN